MPLRLGLIARADNSGLGAQTWEFFRHMQPERTLVIDVGALAVNQQQHCNKRTFLDRYPGAIRSVGWRPSSEVLRRFVQGLDVIFTAETPYDYRVFEYAKQFGVRSALQLNWEFFDYLRVPNLAAPTLFAAPSTWHYDDIAYANKIHLPVPIATDRFTPREHGPTATHFLHIVGRPAAHDRNGTLALLQALQYITATVSVTIKCQLAGHVSALIRAHQIRKPPNVTLIVAPGDADDYWDLYDGDVLVMPRRFGGLCLPAQEALGAGMPVIMPAISPNTDWLPPQWLVPATQTGSFTARSPIDLYSADERALAAMIDHFATDPAFYAAARVTTADLANGLSWHTLKSEYERTLTGAR